MSIKVMSLIWEDHSGNLTGIEKAILLKMADYAADNGTQIFPSYLTLSLTTGFCKRTVLRAVCSLIEKKYLVKIKKGDKGKSNVYKINVDLLKNANNHKKLSTKTVDKSVDKFVDKQVGSDSQSPGGSDSQSPGVVTHSHPKHHIETSYIETSIKDDAFKDNVLEKDLVQKLLNWKVCQKDIYKWIEKYGTPAIWYQIALLKERKTKIRNWGASLRDALKRLEIQTQGKQYA